jgi:hypothetical protein
MKRDMELVRKLVLMIEDGPNGYAPENLKIEGYSAEQVGYHAYLMINAGLAIGLETGEFGSTSPEAMLTSLTWAGHEFAEAARDESRWKKAMAMVREKGGSVTISVLTQILTGLMKGAFGLP